MSLWSNNLMDEWVESCEGCFRGEPRDTVTWKWILDCTALQPHSAWTDSASIKQKVIITFSDNLIFGSKKDKFREQAWCCNKRPLLMPSNVELCAVVCQVRSMKSTQMWFFMGCVSQPQSEMAHIANSTFLWACLFHVDQIGKLMNFNQGRRIRKQSNNYQRKTVIWKKDTKGRMFW